MRVAPVVWLMAGCVVIPEPLEAGSVGPVVVVEGQLRLQPSGEWHGEEQAWSLEQGCSSTTALWAVQVEDSEALEVNIRWMEGPEDGCGSLLHLGDPLTFSPDPGDEGSGSLVLGRAGVVPASFDGQLLEWQQLIRLRGERAGELLHGLYPEDPLALR